jgi:hypothetical protein
VLCVLLAGCAALEDMAVFSGGDTPGKAETAPVAAVPPDMKPGEPSEVLPVDPVDPKRLVGLTREQMVALIGLPVSVTDKAPATVWAYRSEGCSLEVLFYMDLNTRTFRALTYEVHPAASGMQVPASECVGRLRAAHNEH